MKFKPIYVIKSKLNSLPRARGQYVIVTDTGEVYFDRTDNERVLIANKYILPAATNAALGGIKSGSAINVAGDGTVSIPGSGHTHPIGKIEGVTVSAKEVNFLAGTSSNIQSSIESKVPKSTAINGKSLNGDISLTASDVSAVPLTRTVNNKSLGGNIVLNADDVGALSTGARGSTVASLENGKVPSSQLPSFVDDVIEGYYIDNKFYSDASKVNAITGETGKIYVDLTSNKTYRWSGSTYVEISASLALGITSSTAFAGDKGNTLWTNYGTGVNKGSTTTPVYIANGVPTAMTGALPVSLGGTGANNVTSARSNLGLGNVATYNLFDISASATNGFDTTRIAKISSDGVMDIGRYVDFHYNNTANDYISRITCDSSGNLTLTSGKTITATNFSGLASSASKLTTNAGSTTQPIYFAEGIPKAITGNIANGTTGNAATATKLQVERAINGTSFDGTEDITTFKWGAERPITIGNTQKYVDGSNTSGYKWTVAEIGAVNKAGDEMSGNLTIYSTNPTLKIQNSSEGPSNLILERGNNTHSDWKITNTGGNLLIQNDYITSVGDYFNVLTLNYNNGNAIFKGTISAGGTVTAPAFQGNASSASKLTSSAGSTTQPIYFADGVPKAITGNIANGTTGNAATATKLTSSAGNNKQPIYFSDGKPVAITQSIGASDVSIYLKNGVLTQGQQFIPLSGSEDIYGTLRSDSEIQSSNPNAFRLSNGSYGTILNQNDEYFYILKTNENNKYGNYNSLRPFYINHKTGKVYMGHDVEIRGNFNANVKDGYLNWGGPDKHRNFGPIDANLNDLLGGDRFRFGGPKGVEILYSNDGGSTWNDYGATNAEKRELFNGLKDGTSFSLGKKQSDITTKDQLKIILTFPDFGTYSDISKIMIYITNCLGVEPCFLTFEVMNSSNVWVTIKENIKISGWTDWNIINLDSSIRTANNAGNHYRKFSFTFKVEEDRAAAAAILKIQAYGGVGWQTPSKMASTNHLYSWDTNQNMYLPNKLRLEGRSSGNWLTGKTIDNATLTIRGKANSGEYMPILAGKTKSDNVYNIGLLDDSFYICGFLANRTENGRDWSLSVNTSNGRWYTGETFEAGQFVGPLQGKATTAGTADKLGTTTVGSATQPFYLNLGTPTACTSYANATVGTANKLGTSTIGSETKLIYLKEGAPTASSSTVGSSTKPVYLSNGVLTACSSELGGSSLTAAGSSTQPVYINSSGKAVACTAYGNASVNYATSAGTATALGSSAGSATQPVYINSSGKPVACTAYSNASVNYATTSGSTNKFNVSRAIGSSTNPIYINANGVPTACGPSSDVATYIKVTAASSNRYALAGTSGSGSSSSIYGSSYLYMNGSDLWVGYTSKGRLWIASGNNTGHYIQSSGSSTYTMTLPAKNFTVPTSRTPNYVIDETDGRKLIDLGTFTYSPDVEEHKSNNPVYLSESEIIPMKDTIGSDAAPMYLEAGEFRRSTDIEASRITIDSALLDIADNGEQVALTTREQQMFTLPLIRDVPTLDEVTSNGENLAASKTLNFYTQPNEGYSILEIGAPQIANLSDYGINNDSLGAVRISGGSHTQTTLYSGSEDESMVIGSKRKLSNPGGIVFADYATGEDYYMSMAKWGPATNLDKFYQNAPIGAIYYELED